jgi:hypothetical protein
MKVRTDIQHNSFWDTDRNRVMFFGWSHLTGWILANAQTIWIIILMKRYHENIVKNTRKHAWAGYFLSMIGTLILCFICGKSKQKK